MNNEIRSKILVLKNISKRKIKSRVSTIKYIKLTVSCPYIIVEFLSLYLYFLRLNCLANPVYRCV